MMRFLLQVKLITVCIATIFFGPVHAQDDLKILDGWRIYPDAKNALYYHTSELAIRHLEDRKNRVSDIETLAEWKEYQQGIKNTLHEVVGQFPKKTPLKARITGSIEKDSFTIEHIIFESRPGFHVTSSLYLPKVSSGNQKKLPAIIYCSGHTPLGYRSSTYQHVILNLVKKGFIVFAFDPVGQGERMQYFNTETGKSDFARPTHEHSYPGVQLFTTGHSLAQYMIWDGIRAVDYLLTRKEVDPDRIGINGRSGGGTQSAHIAAFDERIYASAPENFITNNTRLLQTKGPQDAEQFFAREIESGLDHPDLLIVRALKPALMITTTNDMFSIQGSMETEEEVAKAYAAYGKSDHFKRIEDLAGHASTKKNREAMYAFFQLHLRNPGSATDQEVQMLSPEELQVTKTGQIVTSVEGETLYSLNQSRSEDLANSLRKHRNSNPDHTRNMVEAAKEISGFEAPHKIPQAIYAGRAQKKGYVLDKYLLKSEGQYPIPFLLLTPDRANGKALLYLDDEGKAVVSRDSVQIERLVSLGYTVLVPDLIGTGELGPVKFHGNSIFKGVSFNVWYSTVLLGRSIVGIRAGDVVRMVDFLKETMKANQIVGVANGNMSAELLHAAAFDSRIDRIALINPLLSYLPIVQNKFYDPHKIHHVVAGALTEYDLPDLSASLAPRKLLLLNVNVGTSSTEAPSNLDDIAVIKAGYVHRKAENQLMIESGALVEKDYDLLMEWIQ
jgi:hypothetical protein